MLALKGSTQHRWLDQVQANLDELLIDHAHCERKAAATAMTLIGAYTERRELIAPLSAIVIEELEHFELVLDLLQRRGIRFRRIKPSNYAPQLHALVRKQEPGRAIDRMLVAGLIEARSCERFLLLRDRLGDQELARFYGDLFESEARHHTTYFQLARLFGPPDAVAARADALAACEAEIIGRGDSVVRIHS
jgi:tRNA-(ms[2]io[6]A)-hydroxylase